jgi:hypothetical protein
MNAITITWPQLLYISLALILFYVAELLLFLRKSSQVDGRGERRQQAEFNQEISRLNQELAALKIRLAALESRSAPQEDVPLPAGVDTPYAHAIRLAQAGADSDAIVGECGISRGEADLIVSLYRTGTLH